MKKPLFPSEEILRLPQKTPKSYKHSLRHTMPPSDCELTHIQNNEIGWGWLLWQKKCWSMKIQWEMQASTPASQLNNLLLSRLLSCIYNICRHSRVNEWLHVVLRTEDIYNESFLKWNLWFKKFKHIDSHHNEHYPLTCKFTRSL